MRWRDLVEVHRVVTLLIRGVALVVAARDLRCVMVRL